MDLYFDRDYLMCNDHPFFGCKINIEGGKKHFQFDLIILYQINKLKKSICNIFN